MSSRKEDEQNSGFGWLTLGVAAAVGAGLGAYLSLNSEPQCNASSSHTTRASSQTSGAYRQRPTPACEPCGICLDDILVVMRLPCGHRFHEKCIKDWIIKKKLCPTCRSPVTLAQSKTE